MSLTPEELRKYQRDAGCGIIGCHQDGACDARANELGSLADELERLQKRSASNTQLSTYREVLIEAERALVQLTHTHTHDSEVCVCRSDGFEALARIRALKLEE